MVADKRNIVDGPLKLSTSLAEGRRTIWLHGELDLASAPTAEAELLEALAEPEVLVTLDMSGLEFIDSTGIALLVYALERGDEGQLCFVPSDAPAVRRVLELTGVAGRLPSS